MNEALAHVARSGRSDAALDYTGILYTIKFGQSCRVLRNRLVFDEGFVTVPFEKLRNEAFMESFSKFRTCKHMSKNLRKGLIEDPPCRNLLKSAHTQSPPKSVI